MRIFGFNFHLPWERKPVKKPVKPVGHQAVKKPVHHSWFHLPHISLPHISLPHISLPFFGSRPKPHVVHRPSPHIVHTHIVHRPSPHVVWPKKTTWAYLQKWAHRKPKYEKAPVSSQRYVTVERRKFPSGGWVAKVAPVEQVQQPVKQPIQPLAVRSEGGSGGKGNNLLPILAIAGGIAAIMLLKKK